MHKFLRAVGFSQFTRKRDIERLLRELAKNAVSRKHIQLDMESNVCEIRAELAPDMGVAIVGEMDDDGEFHEEFYYPYLISRDVTSYAECSIQRHAEKETFAGLLDEYHVGISLIFYMTNSMEYRERLMKRGRRILSALGQPDGAFRVGKGASAYQKDGEADRDGEGDCEEQGQSSGGRRRGSGRHGDADHRGYGSVFADFQAGDEGGYLLHHRDLFYAQRHRVRPVFHDWRYQRRWMCWKTPAPGRRFII